MKQRSDLINARSLPGIHVFQLTDGLAYPSCHLYMEAQVFTPDSQRFLLHQSAHPHGYEQQDPNHQYFLCDLEDHGKLTPLLTETGVAAPSVSPEGTCVYYFVNQTTVGGGSLALKRVDLDGTNRDTLLVLDTPFPGTAFRPSRLYPLSTISSDGKKLAVSAFLGDGTPERAFWGLMVFDLAAATAELILYGKDWCNVHPQYCRATDPEHCRDIMVQHNHGAQYDDWGSISCAIDRNGMSADIHLIRDDGSDFRDFPWGRDDREICQGHQCWHGQSDIAITSTFTNCRREGLTWYGAYHEARLIGGLAVPHQGHAGCNIPGAWRHDLTQEITHLYPDFYHFATNRAGTRLITDSGPRDHGGSIYLGSLTEPSVVQQTRAGVFDEIQLLVQPNSCWHKGMHLHPFLSPDGTRAFFNSNESGILQAYMITLPL